MRVSSRALLVSNSATSYAPSSDDPTKSTRTAASP